MPTESGGLVICVLVCPHEGLRSRAQEPLCGKHRVGEFNRCHATPRARGRPAQAGSLIKLVQNSYIAALVLSQRKLVKCCRQTSGLYLSRPRRAPDQSNRAAGLHSHFARPWHTCSMPHWKRESFGQPSASSKARAGCPKVPKATRRELWQWPFTGNQRHTPASPWAEWLHSQLHSALASPVASSSIDLCIHSAVRERTRYARVGTFHC